MKPLVKGILKQARGENRKEEDGTLSLELRLSKGTLLVNQTLIEMPEVSAEPAPQLPPVAVRPVRDPRRDDDLLEVTEGRHKGGSIELLRDYNGAVAYLRAGGRLYVR